MKRPPARPAATGQRSVIVLRAPTAADEPAFLDAVQRSRRLHGRWVHPPSTQQAYATWLARAAQADHAARLVCLRATGELAGAIVVSNIVRGALRSGYLGYYAFADFEGRGFMRAGLQALVRQAFGALRLHRLEANIQPGNTASLALVRACGFAREGFSPRYLKIGGRWRDHERWAIRAD